MRSAQRAAGASRESSSRLRVFFSTNAHCHAKTLVADSLWASFGSFNFDRRVCSKPQPTPQTTNDTHCNRTQVRSRPRQEKSSEVAGVRCRFSSRRNLEVCVCSVDPLLARRLTEVQRETEKRRVTPPIQQEPRETASLTPASSGVGDFLPNNKAFPSLSSPPLLGLAWLRRVWFSFWEAQSLRLGRLTDAFDPRQAPPPLRECLSSTTLEEESSQEVALRCVELRPESWTSMRLLDRLLCVAAYSITRAVGEARRDPSLRFVAGTTEQQQRFLLPCKKASAETTPSCAASAGVAWRFQGRIFSTAFPTNALATCFREESPLSTWETKLSPPAPCRGARRVESLRLSEVKVKVKAVITEWKRRAILAYVLSSSPGDGAKDSFSGGRGRD